MNIIGWRGRGEKEERQTSSCCRCGMITWLMYMKFIFNLIILLTRVLLFSLSSCHVQAVDTNERIRQQQPQTLHKLAAPPATKMEALAWKYCRLLAEKNFYMNFCSALHSTHRHYKQKLFRIVGNNSVL